MKNLLTILSILIISFNSFGQTFPVVNRANSSFTVQDARVSAQLNLFVPRYADTTAANAGTSEGIDTLGAIIFTYNTMGLWVRSGSPKQWVEIGLGGGTYTSSNGITLSATNFKLGGTLVDSFTHIKTTTRRNGNMGTKIGISNVSRDSSLYLVSPVVNSSLFSVDRFFSQAAGDTVTSQKYGAAANFYNQMDYDSVATQYVGANPAGTQNGSVYAVNRFFPPKDSMDLFTDQFGFTGSSITGKNDFGKTWGYKLHILSTYNYPVGTFFADLDLDRENAGNLYTRRRTITGAGVANFVSNWRNYQGTIGAGTTDSLGYMSKITDFYAAGNTNPFTGSPSKTKSISVSKVDTAIGFWSAPKRTALNEVYSGYGFVQEGQEDYNYHGGRTRFGGVMPTQAASRMNGVLEVNTPTSGIGTISVTASGTTVTGTNTSFLYDFNIGDSITANSEQRRITAIASNTSMTTAAWTSTFAGAYTLSGNNRMIMAAKGTLFLNNISAATTNGSLISQRTMKNFTGDYYDIRSNTTFENTIAATAGFGRGIFNSVNIGAGNTQNWTSGLVGTTNVINIAAGATGLVNYTVGVVSSNTNGASGVTVANMVGYRSNFNTSAGPITYGVGMSIYGLNIPQNTTGIHFALSQSQPTSFPTGNWGIFDQTGYGNYMEGKLLLGDSVVANAGTNKLYVNGKSLFKDSIKTVTPLITTGTGYDIIVRNRTDSTLQRLPYDSIKNIAGTTTNNNAATGNIGEEINAVVSTYTNYTTTSTYQNITSITLTAGDWDLSAFITYNSNSATITAASNAIFVISTTTASAAGSTEGQNIGYIPQAALLGTSKFSDAIPPYRVSISGSTTYYLNTQATFTLGNPQYVGSIRARRLR